MRLGIGETFDRSRSVDLHVGSMAGSRERAVAGVTRGLMTEGQEVTWAARHFGLPFRMTSRISAMTHPTRFVDEQVSGPFKHFRHEHLFVAQDDHTLMVDRVEFAAPFAALGILAERLVLGRYMRRLIEKRNEFLALDEARR